MTILKILAAWCAGASVGALLLAQLIAHSRRLEREEAQRRQVFRAAMARIVAEETGRRRLTLVSGGRR